MKALQDVDSFVNEGLHGSHAEKVQWIDSMLIRNAKIEGFLAKAAGRNVDDPPEILADDLKEGKLLHRLLSGIEKLKGKVKDFVKTCLMTKKGDPEFHIKFGAKRGAPVETKDLLLSMYILIKDSHFSLTKIIKKKRIWILLAATHCNAPLWMRWLDPDIAEDADTVEEVGGGENTIAPAPPLPPVYDAALLHVARNHFFWIINPW